MRHRTLDRLRRSAPVLLLLALAGLAFAQDFSWSPVEWGSNPVVAAIALAGLVVMIRSTTWGARIDGPLRVGAVSVVVGSVGGTGLQLVGLLTVDPYAGMSTPLGGIAYGASLAVFNVTGIAIWNYLAGKVRPVTVMESGLGFAALPAIGNTQSVTDFILGLAREAVGKLQVPAAIAAVAPLLAQFAQSEVVLTDDLRSNLQGKVLSALRKAGLVGVNL